MGILKDAIRKVISETAKESGVEIQFLDSPTRVIKTAAQAKYDDVRRVERGYVQGVHRARKEAAAPVPTFRWIVSKSWKECDLFWFIRQRLTSIEKYNSDLQNEK